MLEHRGRGDHGRRQGRSDRRWCCGTTQTGERKRAAGRRRVRRDRPHAEHGAVPRSARDWTPTATSSRTTARRRACPACSRAATCRITSTGRRSPPPARAAWPRSTPSTISTDSRSTWAKRSGSRRDHEVQARVANGEFVTEFEHPELLELTNSQLTELQSIHPPPSTTVAVVEHHRLAGRDRELRLVEDDLRARRPSSGAIVAGAA